MREKDMTMKAKVRMMKLLALKTKEAGHETRYIGSLKKVQKARRWVPRKGF